MACEGAHDTASSDDQELSLVHLAFVYGILSLLQFEKMLKLSDQLITHNRKELSRVPSF